MHVKCGHKNFKFFIIWFRFRIKDRYLLCRWPIIIFFGFFTLWTLTESNALLHSFMLRKDFSLFLLLFEFLEWVIIGLSVFTVEKSEHKFLFTTFLFKKTSVVVVGLSREIVSCHLVILKKKLFTNRFAPFSLRCKSLLFNILKFIFSLSTKHRWLVRHCCLIKSLTYFRFLSNLSFLIIKLKI